MQLRLRLVDALPDKIRFAATVQLGELVIDQFTGCIINVTSVSSTVASVNRGEYCIAKAGLSMVTQLYAARLGEFEIPVYEIRPGVIATDMTSGVKEKYDKMFSEGLAVQKRWGVPEDIGKAAAGLARGDFPGLIQEEGSRPC